MWKDIEDWEEFYEINEDGDVRNKQTGHLVIGDRNSGGYQRVCLYKKGHNPPKKRYSRHILVAKHFVPNPDNKPEVNHKDLDIDHNYASNLEWSTKRENELHSRMFGGKEYKPFEVVYESGEICCYDCATHLAEELHVTRRTVVNWLHGDNHGYRNYGITEIGYIFD